MTKSNSFILLSVYYSVFSFFSIPSYAINSPREADEMREKASVYYQKNQYNEAEETWKSILESQYKTYDDLRKAASVYVKNKKYKNVCEIYNQMIEDQKDTLGDLKNFLYSLINLISHKEDVDNYSKNIQYAYEKVHKSEYSDRYEIHIADKVFKWVNREKFLVK